LAVIDEVRPNAAGAMEVKTLLHLPAPTNAKTKFATQSYFLGESKFNAGHWVQRWIGTAAKDAPILFRAIATEENKLVIEPLQMAGLRLGDAVLVLGNVRTEKFSADCAGAVLRPQQLLLAQVQTVALENTALQFDQPVDLAMDGATNSLTVTAANACNLVVKVPGVTEITGAEIMQQDGSLRSAIPAGRTTLSLGGAGVAPLLSAAREAAASFPKGDYGQKPSASAPASNPAMEKIKTLAGREVTALAPFNEERFVFASKSGELGLLNVNGDVQTIVTLSAPARAVCEYDYDADGRLEIAAGCADGKVRIIDPAGKELLQVTLHPALSQGRLDVDGDKLDELAVWQDNSELAVIDPLGRVRWKMALHGTLGPTAFGDVDDDGRDEAVAATADGERMVLAFKSDGSVEAISARSGGAAASVLLADVDQDGKTEVVWGGANGVVNAECAGQTKWTVPMGSQAINAMTADGKGGVVIGSAAGFVARLDGRTGAMGKVTQLGAAVEKICRVRNDLAVLTQGGELVLVDNEMAILQRMPLPPAAGWLQAMPQMGVLAAGGAREVALYSLR